MEIDPTADPMLGAHLHTLQQAAYRIEAELIGDDRIPPTHESINELRAQPLKWVGAFWDERADLADVNDLRGAIAWEIEKNRVVISRLIVRPDTQRRGVATRLVSVVLSQAGNRPVSVSTSKDNSPAHALYGRLGFLPTGYHEAIPGLWISDFERPSHGSTSPLGPHRMGQPPSRPRHNRKRLEL